jgi:hypothetical protein
MLTIFDNSANQRRGDRENVPPKARKVTGSTIPRRSIAGLPVVVRAMKMCALPSRIEFT